jgi:PhnB protein
MTQHVNAVPKGSHTLTPYLRVKDATAAIEFYKKAFGAEELTRMAGPDGKIMHACLQIGDSKLFLSDEFPQQGKLSPTTIGGATTSIHMYIDDVDTAFERAVKAGATAEMPVSNMFWGDRYGTLTDPFGHHWGLATHIEDLSPAEIEKRQQEFFKQMAGARK